MLTMRFQLKKQKILEKREVADGLIVDKPGEVMVIEIEV